MASSATYRGCSIPSIRKWAKLPVKLGRRRRLERRNIQHDPQPIGNGHYPHCGCDLAFVMTYELIQMVTEKNNMHDIDTFMFFKWVFKTFAAVLIVTNTWNIVMGIFDMAQQVVNQSAGVIVGNTSLDLTTVVPSPLKPRLKQWDWGAVGAVVSIPVRGAYYERPFHLHYAGDLRQDDKYIL